MGHPIRELFPPEIAERSHQAVQQALAEQAIQHLEYEYILPGEAQPRFFEARFSASAPDQVIVLIRDVTEEKWAGQRLEEQRALLRQVIDINPNFIFAKDKHGRFFLASDRILEEISLPFNLQGNQVVVSTSIGIVIGSANYERPEDVLRDAEIAMYRAKTAGRARYVPFSNVMRADVVASLQLENDLRHAIEYHELELHFEPIIISLENGEMISIEALVRWRHPQRGFNLSQ